MSAFSSSETCSLERKSELSGEAILTENDLLTETYEINKCVEWIKEINAKKICLQFPDSMLGDSVRVSLLLHQLSGSQIFVLGDTTYGACCVDHVAAKHVSADALIHFGISCLSPSSCEIPVLFVFEKKFLDKDKFGTVFKERFTENDFVLLLYDTAYSHYMDSITESLSPQFSKLVVSKLVTRPTELQRNTLHFGREFPLANNTVIKDYTILFIGHDGRCLTNFVLDLPECSFLRFDPETSKLSSVDCKSSLFLRRRLYLVERAKDASTIAALVGTLGVTNVLQSVARIQALAKRRGQKCRLIAVGKPNVPKLANFPEVDVFVLVACPENSLLDTKEYYKPLVTPFDLELAADPMRSISHGYVTDFTQLLEGGRAHSDLSQIPSPDGETDISLVTGRLRSIQTESIEVGAGDSDAVALKAESALSTVSGAGFLSGRSWRGLEQNLGGTDVVLAQAGRSGIAQDYGEQS